MRVLILSVTAGFGHHATAKAIGDMLESKGAEVHTLDVYAYISNLIKTTIDKGYLFSSKHMQTLWSTSWPRTTAQAILTLRRALSISSTHSVRPSLPRSLRTMCPMLSSVRMFLQRRWSMN